MLQVFAIGMFPLAVLFGYSSVFSGSGYNMPYFISSMISESFVAIPFAVIAIYIFNAPIIFLWISYVVGNIVEMISILIFYRNGKWTRMKVTD